MKKRLEYYIVISAVVLAVASFFMLFLPGLRFVQDGTLLSGYVLAFGGMMTFSQEAIQVNFNFWLMLVYIIPLLCAVFVWIWRENKIILGLTSLLTLSSAIGIFCERYLAISSFVDPADKVLENFQLSFGPIIAGICAVLASLLLLFLFIKSFISKKENQ